jgi:hypothetical protein
LRSPDGGDVLALTFTHPIATAAAQREQDIRIKAALREAPRILGAEWSVKRF